MVVRFFKRPGCLIRILVRKERVEYERERIEGGEQVDSQLRFNQPRFQTKGMNPCDLYMDEEYNCSESCPRYSECGSDIL